MGSSGSHSDLYGEDDDDASLTVENLSTAVRFLPKRASVQTWTSSKSRCPLFGRHSREDSTSDSRRPEDCATFLGNGVGLPSCTCTAARTQHYNFSHIFVRGLLFVSVFCSPNVLFSLFDLFGDAVMWWCCDVSPNVFDVAQGNRGLQSSTSSSSSSGPTFSAGTASFSSNDTILAE